MLGRFLVFGFWVLGFWFFGFLVFLVLSSCCSCNVLLTNKRQELAPVEAAGEHPGRLDAGHSN